MSRWPIAQATSDSDDRIEGNPSSARGFNLARSAERHGGRKGRSAGQPWRTKMEDARTAETWAWHLRGMTAHPSRPSRVLTRLYSMANGSRRIARIGWKSLARNGLCESSPGKSRRRNFLSRDPRLPRDSQDLHR